MDWLAFWQILAGILCNSACAMLGCYLVLRRMSLLGDAISHAILPGIVVAVILTKELNGWPVFVGAVLVGILTAFLTQALTSLGNVPEDSSMGVIFTSLFALGVVLINAYVRNVDLDPGCVLYGMIELAPFYTVDVAGMQIPRAVVTLAVVSVVTLAFVIVFWKELKIVSFDGGLATAMGISAVVVHYLLMCMVAVVTVASFEAVGSILVIAMLIVPPATAHLLTDRLWSMQLLAVACATLSAILGYWGASYWETSVAGMMAVVAGMLFVLAVCLAPQHGLVAKAIHKLRLTTRIIMEDLLATMYRVEERAGRDQKVVLVSQAECVKIAGGSRLARWVIPYMSWRGFVTRTADGHLTLTPAGRGRGESLVRSHRLWEAYLDKHFDLPRDHLHEPASRIEHYLGPDLQQELSAELSTPAQDPHGQAIPPALPPIPGAEKLPVQPPEKPGGPEGASA